MVDWPSRPLNFATEATGALAENRTDRDGFRACPRVELHRGFGRLEPVTCRISRTNQGTAAKP